MEIKTEQLAQLLLGIARAQQAIIDALENSKAGFRSTHFRPSIETAARLRANRPEALVDFPARLLLQLQSRNPPDAETVLRDLERFLAAPVVPASGAASAGPQPPEDDSLDMTR